jgi:hypothetical protein
MPSYLIEIPHSGNVTECRQIIKLFLDSGSHLLSNADWGCKDGIHKSWFIHEFDSKDQALLAVPPLLRHDAIIVELTKFNKADMADLAEHS